MGFKVVVTDYVFPNLETEKRELKKIGADLIESQGKGEDSIIEAAKDADGLLVCYAEITSKVINSLEKCRVIARYGIGMNNVDVDSATKKKIIVTNVPDASIEEVSDQALTLILSSARKVCQLNKVVKNGKWDFKDCRPMYRLKGQTLGLVSFGKIPRRLAEKVQAYDFKILVYDPFLGKEVEEEYNIKLVSFKELLKKSDIISIHTPLNDKTAGMFGAEQFKMMKKSAYIINTSRGGLIKDKELADALKNGEITGAGLDVLEDENVGSNHPLVKLENVIITPHSAFYSEQSLKDTQYKAVQEVVSVLTGKIPRSCVNKEVLENQ